MNWKRPASQKLAWLPTLDPIILSLLLCALSIPGCFLCQWALNAKSIPSTQLELPHVPLSAPSSSQMPPYSHAPSARLLTIGLSKKVMRPIPQASNIPDQGNLLARFFAAMEKAGPQENETAKKLMRFASTAKMSEIRDIKPDEFTALLQYLEDHLLSVELAPALEALLKLPGGTLLSQKGSKPAALGLFNAIQGTSAVAEAPVTVVFTDRCEPDGRITGNTRSIPENASRVYAIFENKGSLAGLDHVFAVWRDLNNDEMVFTEQELLRPNSHYNYVWLQPDTGWPAGSYQLELHNPADDFTLLARRNFHIQ